MHAKAGKWGFRPSRWNLRSGVHGVLGFSFDVYNMHAKAGKWGVRSARLNLRSGVRDGDHVINQ